MNPLARVFARTAPSRRSRWGWSLVLAGTLLSGWWHLSRDSGAWITIEPRDLVITVPVEGGLEAVESVSVSPPAVPQVWNFKIAMLAPEGAEVTAGQPLVAFDTGELRQKLRSYVGERDSAGGELEKRISELEIERQNLTLELAESEAALRRHELRLEIPEALVAERDVAQARIDRDLARIEVQSLIRRLEFLDRRSEAELAALRRRRDRASQRVEELEASLAAMRVVAPRDGTVIYTQNRGEKPRVGESVWRGQTILELPDLAQMIAIGQVDEARAGRLRTGQRVEFRLDAHPDRPITGTVQALHDTVKRRSVSDPSKVVEIEIALEATDPERMRPGMRFRGAVEVERAAGILCLPVDVPEPGPDGPVVVAKRGATERRVTPHLGRRDAVCHEILEGLAAGDRVRRPGGTG